MSGASIQRAVSKALGQAGKAVGRGPMIVTLQHRVPGDSTAWPPVKASQQPYDLIALNDEVRLRDQNGSLIDETRRVLTVEAGKVRPTEGDQVLIEGKVFQVQLVKTTSPAGVDLMHELDIVEADREAK